MTALSLPKRPKGRPRAAQNARFDLDLAAWCAGILEINSTLDFRVSSRGWCYILEEKGGVLKGDFDVAQKRINACRKSGLLPLDICCDDDGRAANGLEYLDVADVEKMAAHLLGYVAGAHRSYDPISFWGTQPKYIEMATEKIDLKSLFSRECRPYHLPITNFSGWTDINSRAAMMKRFASIAGWHRLAKFGHFKQPASAIDAVRRLEDLGSPICAFTRECCNTGPAFTISTDQLFGAWQDWCSTQGRDRPGTKQTFGRDLRAACPAIKLTQPRDEGNRYRLYQGIRLK